MSANIFFIVVPSVSLREFGLACVGKTFLTLKSEKSHIFLQRLLDLKSVGPEFESDLFAQKNSFLPRDEGKMRVYKTQLIHFI